LKISIVLAALTGTFETDMNRASKTAQKRMREIEKTAKEVGKVLGTALVAGATAAAVALKAAIDRADELYNAAQKIGTTTESLSTLAYAAELADVELGTLQSGLARLTRFQAEAAQGTEKNVELFEALGIAFRNADGTLRDTTEVFRDVARLLETMPDGANKSAVALDLLGRSGTQLIPMTRGLAEAEQRARDLGLELENGAGKAADEFNDRLGDLKFAATGLATAVAVELLPDLNDMVGAMQEGVEQGDGFAATAENIANGIRGIVFVADKAFQTIKALVLGITSLTASATQFAATYGPMRLFSSNADRQALGNLAAVAGAGAWEAYRSTIGEEGESSPGGFTRTQSRKVEIDQTTDALTRYYASRANATAADKAAADAARAAAEAQRELQRILDEGNEAREGLIETVQQNAADLAGPAAQAARAYADELTRLVGEEEKLRAAKLLTADTEAQLALAREQAFSAYQKQLDEISAAETKAYDDLLADLQFELELLGLTNLEREKAIALRYANVDAASAEGQAIAAALDDLDRAQRVAEGMDVVRDATSGLFEDLISGAKSASEAFKDFVDNILDGIAQIVARNLTEQLLGSFGSTGGGQSGGGWLSSLFGSFFGGARAGGGDVMAGVPYLVGEQGPELMVPSSSGTVIPAGKTAAMLGGRATVIQNFNMPGRYDLRTQAQVSADAGRATQRALARGTA
jgi:hypothetical protein